MRSPLAWNVFRSPARWLVLWSLLPVTCWLKDFFKGKYNNYKIFKGVYWHLVEERNLYAQYPSEHGDMNHYGPSFALIIAPFAVLPDVVGVLLWGLVNVFVYYYAVRRLRLSSRFEGLFMLLVTIELANSVWANQFNPAVAAMVIIPFVLVEERKDFWAPLLIMLGTFIKLYAIVALVFFLFSHNKVRFVAGCVVWSIVVFMAPMILSSPEFVIQSYIDWYHSLADKNLQSVGLTSSQDISVMGFVRRILSNPDIPNWPFLITAAALVMLPLLRFSQYAHKSFRIAVMSSLLMFVVLFSPGSEHPTYIICVTGLFLWMMFQEEPFSRTNQVIIFFVIIVTGLASTDILTVPVRKFTILYALKAVPCAVVWALVIWQLLFFDFAKLPDRTIGSEDAARLAE